MDRSQSSDDLIRVMVVDDSAVIRGLITRSLETDPEVKVVASVGDGKQAVSQIGRTGVDVVVLDIEMPVMDGMTALPLLLEASSSTKVIMASTLTERNADISLKAMEFGASDYVAKPTSTREISTGQDFKTELLSKVKVLGTQARRDPKRRSGGAAAGRSVRPTTPVVGVRRTAGGVEIVNRGGEVKLRPMPTAFRPQLLAIGSSTGGPQALFQVLRAVGKIKVPIILTQHMPKTFTTILAEHITRQCGITAVEAVDGMPLQAGRVHLAPGDYHMVVEGKPGAATLRLNQNPPENFCRPSVDPMLRSVVSVFGGRVLVAILTGMGQDGMLGCRQIVNAGGAVFAQDEATSVVWGMPGAVAVAGLCAKILPVEKIGPEISQVFAT